MTRDAHKGQRSSLPAAIWTLGLVSLLADISSDMVFSLLPVYMVEGLGASAAAVGLVEGLGESTALVVKIFSGAFSDYLRRRKPFIVLGYGLAALAKPLFALAGGVATMAGARVLDRVGKGLRDAPRDALIAEITPSTVRGEAFGLRQALDTIGALVGPLAAAGLLFWSAGNFRLVFWLAALPGILACGLILFGLHEARAAAVGDAFNPLALRQLRQLGTPFWYLVGIGSLFSLARFSEAFLVLRALDNGLPAAWVPLIMATLSASYAAWAYPFGWLADRLSHAALLAAGIGVLILADLVLATAGGWKGAFVGASLWGLHLAMTQGLFAAMVAAASPAALRGTAYGLFNLAAGLALLLSSAGAGLLWDRVGPAAPFLASALCAAAALLCLRLRAPA